MPLKFWFILLVTTLFLGGLAYLGYRYYITIGTVNSVDFQGTDKQPIILSGKIQQAGDLGFPRCTNYFLVTESDKIRLVNKTADESFSAGASALSRYKNAEVEIVGGDLVKNKDIDSCRNQLENKIDVDCVCTDIINLDPKIDIKVTKEGKDFASTYEGEIFCSIKEGNGGCGVYGLRIDDSKTYMLNFLQDYGVTDDNIGERVKVSGIINRLIMDVFGIAKSP